MRKGYLGSVAASILAVLMISAYVVSNENGNAIIEDDATLVGIWVQDIDLEQAPLTPVGVDTLHNFDLLKDGTGVYMRQANGIAGGITWRAENGRLYMFTRGVMVDNNAFVLNYKLSGATLSLSDWEGRSATFTRQR